MRVSDVLRTKGLGVVTIPPDSSVQRLLALLAEHRIGAAVVSRDGRSVDGIVSERDVARALAGGDATVLDRPVAEICTTEVFTATPETEFDDLMRIMTEHRIRHVPVVVGGTLRTIAEHLAAVGIHMSALRIVAELGSTQAVLQGIKNGVGISIVSVLAAADDLKAGALKTLAIEGLDLKRQFFLTRHRQRTPSPVCRAFVDFLRQQEGFAGVLTPEMF